jgi:hypothetical protein
METYYIAADNTRELASILGDMASMGYIDYWDEETIEEIDPLAADYDYAYRRHYGNIQPVYDYNGFRNCRVYAVEVAE